MKPKAKLGKGLYQITVQVDRVRLALPGEGDGVVSYAGAYGTGALYPHTVGKSGLYTDGATANSVANAMVEGRQLMEKGRMPSE